MGLGARPVLRGEYLRQSNRTHIERARAETIEPEASDSNSEVDPPQSNRNVARAEAKAGVNVRSLCREAHQ